MANARTALPSIAVFGSTKNLVAMQLAVLGVGVLFAVLSISELRGAESTMDELTVRHAETAILAERLIVLNERTGRASRSFLLTGQQRHLDELAQVRTESEDLRRKVWSRLADPISRAKLEEATALDARHEAALARALLLRRTAGSADAVIRPFEEQVQPWREQIRRDLDALGARERDAFVAARDRAARRGKRAVASLIVAAVLAGVAVTVLLGLLQRAVRRLNDSRTELDAALQRLEDKNRELDAFAGRVAHDLGNLLAPLRMDAQRLTRTTGDELLLRASAERMQRASQRATEWLNALLAFARANHRSDLRSAASVEDALHQVFDSLSSQRAQVGAELEAQVETLSVACAPGLLQVVLLNLVGNALKFLVDRPVRRVAVKVRRFGAMGEISIEDTGPGIGPEDLPRIFEPFYRARGTTAPGHGMGLATVQRIVQSHGGTIAVASTVGQGTRVVVRLPLSGGEVDGPGIGGERRAGIEAIAAEDRS